MAQIPGPQLRRDGSCSWVSGRKLTKEQDQSLSRRKLSSSVIVQLQGHFCRGGIRRIHNQSVPEIPPKEKNGNTLSLQTLWDMFSSSLDHFWASQVALVVKEPACQCQCSRLKRCRFDLCVGKISWRRKRQPTPILLLGKSHGQRSLAGCSPWGCKESDATGEAT